MRNFLSTVQVVRDSRRHYLMNEKSETGTHDRGFTEGRDKMSEKKYQVFISSTYKDLKKERMAAQEAILKTNNFPVGMEQFSAVDIKQWDVIKKTIDESDYFVLIIGKMYGTIINEEGISYTHKEFNYDKSIGIPILAFIKLDNAKTRTSFMEKDNKRKKALQKFVKEVSSDRICDYWGDDKDIRFLISVSLSKAIKSNPRLGWIKCHENGYSVDEHRNWLRDVEEKVIELLSQNEKIGIKAIAKELNLSMKHTRIILQDMTQRKIIIENKEKKGCKWSILNKIS